MVAPIIDHAGTDNPGNTQVVTETIQISQPNALVFFYWPGAASATVPISSFTSSPPLTWKNPPWVITSDGAGFTPSLFFYAAAPNAGLLTMTMALSAPINRFFKVFWFDVLGADLTSPFDGIPFSDKCCPQGNPNTITGVSTNYPDDLLLAFESEVSGSVAGNNPTFNAPFSEMVTNINGGFSVAMSWAYYRSSSILTNATFTPVNWAISSVTRGTIFAIKSAPGSPPPTPTNITVTARPH